MNLSQPERHESGARGDGGGLPYVGFLAALLGLAAALSFASFSRPESRRPVFREGAPKRPLSGQVARALVKTAGRALYAAFILALLGLTAALLLALVPRLLGYATLVVHGGSMGQAAPNGSIAVARWIDAQDVKLGDIILVQDGSGDRLSRPRIHRVVWLQASEGAVLVRTHGDANLAADPGIYILPDRVLTPAYDLPYLGYLVGSVGTPLGWLFLVALPAAALCASALHTIWSGERRPAAKPLPA